MKHKLITTAALVAVLLLSIITSCTTPIIPPDTSSNLKTFASVEELETYVQENQVSGNNFRFGFQQFALMEEMADFAPMSAGIQKSSAAANDFSTTNIQVEGVDEADFVKNDGKYMYVVSGSTLVIVEAFPADTARIVSKTLLPGPGTQLFVNKDKLIVFGREDVVYAQEKIRRDGMIADVMPPRYPTSNRAYALTYDISDRADPVVSRRLSFDGSYTNSRMIGDYVYLLVRQPLQWENDHIVLPMMTIDKEDVSIDRFSKLQYFDAPSQNYQFTNVVSFNVHQDSESINSQVYLMDAGSNIFVSQNTIYVSYQKQLTWKERQRFIIQEVWEDIVPVEKDTTLDKIEEQFNALPEEERTNFEEKLEKTMREVEQQLQRMEEQTSIHKIAIHKGDIQYVAQGSVPGRILNQFSMDEWDGHFRIATTVGQVWNSKFQSSNNVYVLDKTMNLVGSIENIAPGESIKSVRFMGKRGYVVTFKNVDPLFVIDLAQHNNPQILGKLKIPGYSDYLQPYDETHLIGIGKEVDESIDADKVHSENAVYYTAVLGVKMAIFDVSDVEHPIELHKTVLGDRGTESIALREHKAVLFDKEKDLFVIPVSLAEAPEGSAPGTEGHFVFDGAMVFDLNLQDGFTERGRISHVEDDATYKKSGSYWYSPSTDVLRSGYIGNVLFTVSKSLIKLNDLESLKELNMVQLPYVEDHYRDDVWY